MNYFNSWRLLSITLPQNSFEVFTTLAYTGMRAGELLALKWSDIDFENNTISITKTYYNQIIIKALSNTYTEN